MTNAATESGVGLDSAYTPSRAMFVVVVGSTPRHIAPRWGAAAGW